MGIFLYIIKIQINQKTDIITFLLCQNLFDLIVLYMLSHFYLRKTFGKHVNYNFELWERWCSVEHVDSGTIFPELKF